MGRLPSRQRVITIRYRKSIVRPGLSPLQNSTMHGLLRCTCDGSFHRNCLLYSRRTDSVWSAEMATIPVAISPVQAGYRCVNVDLPDGGSADCQCVIPNRDGTVESARMRIGTLSN